MIEPLTWLADHNAAGRLDGLTIDAVLIACARVVHIVAVLGALTLMF